MRGLDRDRAGAAEEGVRGVEVPDGRDIAHHSAQKFTCQYLTLRYCVEWCKGTKMLSVAGKWACSGGGDSEIGD